jgi:hypothetical protein
LERVNQQIILGTEKVLRRLGITLTQPEMDALCNCQPLAVERLLLRLKRRIEADKARLNGEGGSRSPSSGTAASESSIVEYI